VTGESKSAGGVPDAVRRAVARTIQSTLGPATLTRERAQELADEVLRRAEDRAARAGRGVRGAGQKPREAAVEVGDRLRDAIADLRGPTADDIEQLRSELELLRLRVDQLERKVSGRLPGGGSSASSKGKPSAGTRRKST
jgi:polyhydroxyalkanoate synthesis regulator phasin